MNLTCFKSCIDGYSDKLFDLQIIAVQSGYWAAYFSNAKRPKPLKQVISEMVNRHKKNEHEGASGVSKPEVDVDAFLKTEAKFLKRLQSK